MKELFKRLRAFLKEKYAGALALVLCLMVLVLVLCLVFGGRASREQVFPVYISEVVSSNTGYPNPDGRCCDIIELHNSADYPVDLSGFQMGDVEGKTRYAFPSGTVIGPGAYLCVYCDKTLQDPSYAPFEISRAGGEVFYLIAKNGRPFCEYMIGSSTARPLKEFIIEMVRSLAPDRQPIFGDIPFTGTNMPLSTFDCTDTERDCGFRAGVSFAEGTRMTMDWLKTIE